MIIATIKKLDGSYLDHGKFESEVAAQAWFQSKIDKGVYGKKHMPAEYADREVVPAVLDELGNELQPAQYESVLVKAEVQSEFLLDIIPYTIPQQEINEEALSYLLKTDYYVIRMMETGVAIPLAISEARQAARERIIK